MLARMLICLILVLFNPLLVLPLEAQTLYRCGKIFQDRPCASAAEGQAISHLGGSQGARPVLADSDCASRGDRAKEITWAREVGRTRDEQLATAKSADDRLLIGDVYQLRGNSNEIATVITNKCVADKEKAAQMAVEAAVLAQMRQSSTASSGAAQQELSAATPVLPPTDSSAQYKKSQCASYAAELDNIRKMQRTGGSGATMEQLRERQRNVDNARSNIGC